MDSGEVAQSAVTDDADGAPSLYVPDLATIRVKPEPESPTEIWSMERLLAELRKIIEATDSARRPPAEQKIKPWVDEYRDPYPEYRATLKYFIDQHDKRKVSSGHDYTTSM